MYIALCITVSVLYTRIIHTHMYVYTIWCSSVVGYWGCCTVCQGHCWHVVRSFHFTYVIYSQTPTVVFKIWLHSLWPVALFLMMGLTPLWCALHVCVHVCASSSNHTLCTLPVAGPLVWLAIPHFLPTAVIYMLCEKRGPAAGSAWTVHSYSFSSPIWADGARIVFWHKYKEALL